MAHVSARYPGINPVFFIGASAGGVNAFSTLASMLPEDFPSPVFFLLHRLRDSTVNSAGLLPLLEAKSNLPVKVAEAGELVRSGHIYLPPDNLHIGVDDNHIFYSDLPDDEPWRPSIDFLFKSGAREYKDRSIAILLTGKLDDGTQGMIETTHQGGITVAQSPTDAYEPHLPLQALMNDHPTHVLPLVDIPKLMCEFVHHPHFANQKDVFEESAKIAKSLKQQLK
ncbi:chemotaxis protein CheB [Alteromonas sp. A079]|uniref:chemotaxis protein CheB n=1 Tax=Alteromonas sp. A079 TaxID=3410268 RepID=UPI003BA33283